MSLLAKIDRIKDAMRAKEAGRLPCACSSPRSSMPRLKQCGRSTPMRSRGHPRASNGQDAVEGFVKGGRPEQAEKEKAEMTLLESYLPAGLSAEELSALVREAIAETGATGKAQMGAVMKVVMAKAAGRVDGKAVNQEVQKQLG